jgi:hypothetical protein
MCLTFTITSPGVDGTAGWGERRCHPLDRAGRVAVPLLQRRRNHQERAAKVPAVVTAIKLKPPERAIMMCRQWPVYPHSRKPPLSRRELERPMCVDFCRNGGGHTANHLIDQTHGSKVGDREHPRQQRRAGGERKDPYSSTNRLKRVHSTRKDVLITTVGFLPRCSRRARVSPCDIAH